MGILADASGEYLLHSGNVGTIGAANLAMCGWVWVTTAGGGNNGDWIFGFSHSSNGRCLGVAFDGSANLGVTDNGGAALFAAMPDAGRWFWLGFTSPAAVGAVQGAWRYPGCAPRLVTRINGTEGSVQMERTGAFIARVGDTANTLAGRLHGLKAWNRKLTLAELLRESEQIAPASPVGLHGFWPFTRLAGAEFDYSGNRRTFTVTGTLADTDAPPVPWQQARRPVLFAETAAGGAAFTKIAGERFALAGPGGLAG